jgi:hypothetical protein
MVRTLVSLALAVLVVLAVLAVVDEAARRADSWDRKHEEDNRVNRRLSDEDLRLTRLIDEAEDRGDTDEAAKLRAERQVVSDKIKERIRLLNEGR